MRWRVAAPGIALAAVWLAATTLGPTALAEPSDLPVYRAYADALGSGLLPYRDFALEYPPLALVPIAVGGALGIGAMAYPWTFGALMLGAALVVQREAARLAGGRGELVAWGLVALPVAAGAIVRTRFDLFPAALAVAGVATLAVRGRVTPAFVLLGLGAATKLFPALLAAVAAAWLLADGRRAEARRGVAAFLVVVAVVCLPFAVASPRGFAEQFTFHRQRPVQVESSPATVLWALGRSQLTGVPGRPDRFRSNGLAGGPADAVAAVFAVLQLVGVAAAVALATRRPPPGRGAERLVLASLAALLAFVALGKVLSPQYELWLVPFAAAALACGAQVAGALVLLTVPLTQLEFPARYAELVGGETGVVALVGVRNALLLAACALILRRLASPARSRRPAAAPSSG